MDNETQKFIAGAKPFFARDNIAWLNIVKSASIFVACFLMGAATGGCGTIYNEVTDGEFTAKQTIRNTVFHKLKDGQTASTYEMIGVDTDGNPVKYKIILGNQGKDLEGDGATEFAGAIVSVVGTGGIGGIVNAIVGSSDDAGSTVGPKPAE